MALSDILYDALAALFVLYVRIVKALFELAVSKSKTLQQLAHGSEILQASLEPVDLDGGHPPPGPLTRSLNDLVQIDARGLGFRAQDIPAYLDVLKNANGEGINDRKFFLEKVLTLMARAPDDFAPTKRLQQAVIDLLYKDLPHPPGGYLSLPPSVSVASTNARVSYAFRSADGSNYNPLAPTLGMANMPYARSVPSANLVPRAALPDPGLVFDTLLKREKFEPHPGGISSLFFAFADLIIHCLFNTDPRDWTKNATNSYLDLSVLYGASEQQVDGMRKKDGTGMIWEDAFADPRLMLMPPAVGALLVIFNRNHNYICQKIQSINENGNLVDPPPQDADARQAQDDELFQRARLVNSGFFMQVILADYVGAILGLVRDGLAWRLDPLAYTRQLDHEVSPRGEGNAVSIEFNLMYRWHATTSQIDEQWTEQAFKKFWPGKNFQDITIDDFKNVAVNQLRAAGDPKKWPIGDLQRNSDGRFDDAQLAQILQNATEHPASAFGARRTPEVLRIIEILGMEQARSWGVCTMNEFRKFMGLKPYADFKEWNPDPSIASAAEALYHDIDNLELHVGLQAEETKKPMPGAGLCPGYTISRAILGDAVCLTRGDRFMTVDFTPFNFTSWGYQDCQINPNDGSYGGMLTKLLFRHLPEYYPRDSTYAYFPFMVPSEMKKAVEKLPGNVVEKYSWTRPPVPQVGIAGVNGGTPGNGVAASGYYARMSKLSKWINPQVTETVDEALFANEQLEQWGTSFAKLTRSLIESKSVNHIGSTKKYVDIVKDVINLVPVHWIANEVLGLPLKTDANPRGSLREHELYRRLANVSNYVFLDFDPEADWELRETSATALAEFSKRVKIHLDRLRGRIVDGVIDRADLLWAGHNEHNDAFLKRVLSLGPGVNTEELATNLTAQVISTAALYSKALSLVVDFYLDSTSGEADANLVQLAKNEAASSRAEYVQRINDALENLGLRISHEPFHGLLYTAFFEKTTVQVLRSIFSLPGLTRAPGTSGHLNKFTQTVDDMKEQLYIDSSGKSTPWPASLVVQYN
ncbi:heme peroxidase [Gloeophyllum trabeum ATCC 11539]|uniref:Heme peroxidase n=1 Tax=Gloeophyllum trabeum (strain ATCC 11539 / FP-39264 / Madison 617) TaxID=670483 RepID=S7PW63_GLOTA|nr:heme peroxidase [Gloeophyllum trabeum ATCC 11539]EPQ51552.1 heme peroxidase [Gloeophyllum trabeum ATCC 11539]